jgi:hypothetical protein
MLRRSSNNAELSASVNPDYGRRVRRGSNRLAAHQKQSYESLAAPQQKGRK